MPCKRCRKARIACTISSMDRPVKKSKERILAIVGPEKTNKHLSHRTHGKSSPPGVFEQPSMNNTVGFDHEGIPNGMTSMEPGFKSEDCHLVNGSFDDYSIPFFSGLITPPSAENEHEHSVPLKTPSCVMPQQQDWATGSDSRKFLDVYEIDDCKHLARSLMLDWLLFYQTKI